MSNKIVSISDNIKHDRIGHNFWERNRFRVGNKKLLNAPYGMNEQESYCDVAGLNVLIVDDDLASGLFLRKVVKKFSRKVSLVMSGSEAVDECLNNPDIDLVLKDIRLPDINGYEATRQIRKYNSKVFIVAQTAFALVGDREKAIEAGCNEYIAKPLNKDILLDLIKSISINEIPMW